MKATIIKTLLFGTLSVGFLGLFFNFIAKENMNAAIACGAVSVGCSFGMTTHGWKLIEGRSQLIKK